MLRDEIKRTERLLKKEKRIIEKEEKLIKYEWNHYKTILIIIVIALTLESYITGSLEAFLSSLGQYEYLGAFFAGFFYTYGATTPFAIAVFFVLSQSLNPFLLALVGAFGSIFSEYMIYTFSKNQVRKAIGKTKIAPLLKNKYVIKFSPVIAGIIIASPLPDELAAAFLGAAKYDLKKFLALTFAVNIIAILIISGINGIF